jgi:hypothetical protein
MIKLTIYVLMSYIYSMSSMTLPSFTLHSFHHIFHPSFTLYSFHHIFHPSFTSHTFHHIFHPFSHHIVLMIWSIFGHASFFLSSFIFFPLKRLVWHVLVVQVWTWLCNCSKYEHGSNDGAQWESSKWEKYFKFSN